MYLSLKLRQKLVLGNFFLFLLLCFPIMTEFHVLCNGSENTNDIVVPDNFKSIQDAINNATTGSIIFVKMGVYCEHLIVNKTVSIIGESKTETIIDGQGIGTVISVTADHVNIKRLTIRNSGYADGQSGILLIGCSFNVSENVITKNSYGVYIKSSDKNFMRGNNFTYNNFALTLSNSTGNSIFENYFEENYSPSISLYNSSNNFLFNNVVQHNPAYGIYMCNSENNTVRENIVMHVCDGIFLQFSKNNKIDGNIVANTSPHALYFNYSYENCIRRNLMVDNNFAFYLFGSCGNFISENNISRNKYGIYLQYSGNNTLEKNCISFNWYNFGVFGEGLADFINYIDTSNTVNGKGIYYLINCFGCKVHTDAGYVAIVNSTKVCVENLKLNKNIQGLLLAYSREVLIENVELSDNFVGGMCLFYSNDNTVVKSVFRNNVCGIFAKNSNESLFFHNNFVNNRRQVQLYASSNSWDISYPGGGNYWSDYTGVDLHSGEGQNMNCSDGIGDTGYAVAGKDEDKFPLFNPINSFYLGVWNEITYYFEVSSNCTISDFYFNSSEGAFIRFSAYYGAGIIGSCRAQIPIHVLRAEDAQWEVLVNGQHVSNIATHDENYSYVYFTFPYSSTVTVEIRGTSVIKEFSSIAMFFLLVFLVMFAVFLIKR